MIIAIDFDNTIVYSTYPRIESVRQYAAKSIHDIRTRGHYVIVWTCRCGDDLTAAINYMLENGIEFDRINDNHPDNVREFGFNSRKINADVYIDDRNIGGFAGWVWADEMIQKLEQELLTHKS